MDEEDIYTWRNTALCHAININKDKIVTVDEIIADAEKIYAFICKEQTVRNNLYVVNGLKDDKPYPNNPY